MRSEKPSKQRASAKAASPIKRMGQHLDAKNLGNALLRHPQKKDINPEDCDHFKLIAHGPILPEEDTGWTLRISRGISEGTRNWIVQSDREFLNIWISCGQWKTFQDQPQVAPRQSDGIHYFF